MRIDSLANLLRKGDRVAVSNITGREASKVSVDSQAYADNIVGGWALGKGGTVLRCPRGRDIPVFGTCEELRKGLPAEQQPNRVVVYSPPEAVYGEVKEAVYHLADTLEALFVITENVSIEVTAKIHCLGHEANVDVIGCNALGAVNPHDHVRVGAVGGSDPEGTFRPGSVAIVSNSGNMVNTIASYLRTAGLGVSTGVSTGKDVLILTPLKEYLALAEADPRTKLVILYIEPGGLYEQEAIDWARESGFSKPILVYVAGELAEQAGVSLGHAGAVVEGPATSARGKMALFDEYFGLPPFNPDERYRRTDKLKQGLKRGMRARALHHLPGAAMLVYYTLGWRRDFEIRQSMRLNPWLVNFGELGAKMSPKLLVQSGEIPDPYRRVFRQHGRASLGLSPVRRSMRSASHASSTDGETTRIFGTNLTKLMASARFGEALILSWTGCPPRTDWEATLVEMCLIAALTNGPGTLSAQAAKLSASAGNSPHTGMIATLSAIGDVHGGNGQRAVQYLTRIFQDTDLADPYDPEHGIDLDRLAHQVAERFRKHKAAAKESGLEYERIPCLGHPVFRGRPVNLDPREQAVSRAIETRGAYNVFLDFYHRLARALHEVGVANSVWAVNVDAAVACVWLGVCWPHLKEKRMTLQRAGDIALLAFALGRAAGGAAEFLDHQDHGTPMDMRIPIDECTALTPPRE